MENNFCLGDIIEFTDNSTGTINSWDWNFGDGNTSTDSDPIHTYAAEDDYTVTLTATNECGDVSSTVILKTR